VGNRKLVLQTIFSIFNYGKKKVKMSHNTSMKKQRGEMWLLLIHDLGTRWG
jgi:hypothetical protein